MFANISRTGFDEIVDYIGSFGYKLVENKDEKCDDFELLELVSASD